MSRFTVPDLMQDLTMLLSPATAASEVFLNYFNSKTKQTLALGNSLSLHCNSLQPLDSIKRLLVHYFKVIVFGQH